MATKPIIARLSGLVQIRARIVAHIVSFGVLVAAIGACDRDSGAPPGDNDGDGSIRIVSLMPSTTEMLFAFGAGESVVGVSRFCDFPAEAAERPSIGSGLDPDMERILSLRPDLVVGTIVQSEYDFVRQLENANIDTFFVRDSAIDTLYEDMLALGERVDSREGAARVVDEVQTTFVDIRRRAETESRAERGLRVLLVYDHDPIYAAGGDSFASVMIGASGALNVVDWGDWVQLDRELVIRLAPDVILEPIPASSEVTDDTVRRYWDGLNSVPAVANGRVYALTSRGISRAGPSLAEAALEIERLLFGSPAPEGPPQPEAQPEAQPESQADPESQPPALQQESPP